MDSRRLTHTAPASGGPRPRTGGKVFVEKAQVLDDIISESEAAAQGKRRYVKTQVITQPIEEQARPVRLPPNSTVDFKQSKKDENPHMEAVMMKREKKDKQFPHILAAVDRASNFLDEVDKEMSLAEEAKRNKTRRQFEEWNTNVHGEIQVGCYAFQL